MTSNEDCSGVALAIKAREDAITRLEFPRSTHHLPRRPQRTFQSRVFRRRGELIPLIAVQVANATTSRHGADGIWPIDHFDTPKSI